MFFVAVVVVAVAVVAVVAAVVAVAPAKLGNQNGKMAIYNSKQKQIMVSFHFDCCR